MNLTAMGVGNRGRQFHAASVGEGTSKPQASLTRICTPQLVHAKFRFRPHVCGRPGQTGGLHLPAGDAKLSFIDVRDVAAVAFAALTRTDPCGKGVHPDGRGCPRPFRGGRPHIARRRQDHSLYVPISEEAAKAGLAKRGVPDGSIRRWTAFFEKVRQGLCAPVTPDVESVLGRPAISFARYAEDYAPAWR